MTTPEQLTKAFKDILAIVLPATLRFQRLRVQSPDVILETHTGPIPLDAVSGGISASSILLGSFFLYSQIHDKFIVVVDEPEVHLHPQLQKAMLPSMLEAFPTAQFVVATHNPFVVTSVPDSNVYVLQYNPQNRVISTLLGDINKAGTSNQVLRTVLGVDSASPTWVDRRFEDIISQHESMEMSADVLRSLRAALEEIGLGAYVPAALDRLLGGR